jgi:hypothetical protein
MARHAPELVAGMDRNTHPEACIAAGQHVTLGAISTARKSPMLFLGLPIGAVFVAV